MSKRCQHRLCPNWLIRNFHIFFTRIDLHLEYLGISCLTTKSICLLWMISKKTLLLNFLTLRQSKFDLYNKSLFIKCFENYLYKYKFKGSEITARKAGFNVQYADRYRKFQQLRTWQVFNPKIKNCHFHKKIFRRFDTCYWCWDEFKIFTIWISRGIML